MSAKNVGSNSIETRNARVDKFDFETLVIEESLTIDELNATQGNFQTVTANQVNAGTFDVEDINNDAITSKRFTVLGTAETGTLGKDMVLAVGGGNLGLRRGLGIAPDGEDAFTDDPPTTADSGIYFKGQEFQVISERDIRITAGQDLEMSTSVGSAQFFGNSKTVIGLEGTDLVLRGNVIVSPNTTGSIVVDPAVDPVTLNSSAGSFVLALGSDIFAVRDYLLTKIIGSSLDFLPGETQKLIRGALFIDGAEQVAGIQSGIKLPGVPSPQQVALEFLPTVFNVGDPSAFISMRNVSPSAIGSNPISVAVSTGANFLGL